VAVVVNEQGTEAAAVTAVVLDRGDHGRLIVDRPFVFAVVDEALPDADADGSAPTVLFLGAVADPG
jgi:serine protease inhibitor